MSLKKGDILYTQESIDNLNNRITELEENTARLRWRYISEAPRDGTRLWCHWAQFPDSPDETCHFKLGAWRDDFGAEVNDPTHFMALPESPR